MLRAIAIKRRELPRWFAVLWAAAFGCQTSEPSSVIVENRFSAPDTVVYKVWYRTTLFVDALASNVESEPHDSVLGEDYVYALIAAAPADGSAPSSLVGVRSRAPVAIGRGETKRIVLSEQSTEGACSGLSREIYDEIASRYFPSDAVAAFDSAPCRGANADAGDY